jgi:diguanylate cyclase (GGDEF)-like protein
MKQRPSQTDPTTVPEAHPALRVLRRPTPRAALLALASVVLLLAVVHLPVESDGILIYAQSAVTLATALAAAGLVVRQRRHWKVPARELERVVAEVRAGEAPIEEVRKTAAGGLAPLATTVADLLHEVRRREQAHAQLEWEMSRRVASRTGALERSLASVRSQAHHDSLSGLYNRRALDEMFPRLLEQCRADRTELYVLMIDMDRFKQVNDTLGHAAGDALISDVGDLIRSSVRHTDLAFRFGGDEFTILLPGADRAEAQGLADRLTRLGAQLGQSLRIRPAPGLSVGMTSLAVNPSDAAPADLMRAADAALYKNKSARRSA